MKYGKGKRGDELPVELARRESRLSEGKGSKWNSIKVH
jgi:hypothetical protein